MISWDWSETLGHLSHCTSGISLDIRYRHMKFMSTYLSDHGRSEIMIMNVTPTLRIEKKVDSARY